MWTAAGQSGVGDAAEGRGEAPKMGAELLTKISNELYACCFVSPPRELYAHRISAVAKLGYFTITVGRIFG